MINRVKLNFYKLRESFLIRELYLLPLDSAASTASGTAVATADLVLLSGSLLYLDLCINFLLYPHCGGRRMLMRAIAATTLGVALVLLHVVTAELRLLAT